MASKKRGRMELLIWTDDEVEHLLRVALDYKATKTRENVDWESCPTKYADITAAFQAQYPQGTAAIGRDFPHDARSISKNQIAAKVKNIRWKYRLAVENGRRTGQGRVILLFHQLCSEIWGGEVDGAVIEVDLEEASSLFSMQTPSPATDMSSDSSLHEPSMEPVVTLPLEEKPNIHRVKGVKKRELSADSAVREDLMIKRRLLTIMEQADKRNANFLQQINTNVANITSTIQEGFSLLRELMQQQRSDQTDFDRLNIKTETL